LGVENNRVVARPSLLSRALGAAGVIIARAAQPSRPEISALDVDIDDLGAEFDGYTIAVISDLHHPPTADVQWLRGVVDATNAWTPDLIAMLGDYGWSFKHMRRLARPWYGTALRAMTHVLEDLRARDGVVALVGNHDYYADVDAVRGWLESIGADVLVNRTRVIRRANSSLCVTGLDDFTDGQRGIAVDGAAVEAAPGRQHPTIVVAHNPDSIATVPRDVRVDVMLAGHTHGGQIVLPWYGAPVTMTQVCGPRTASGWVPHERAPLYVTRGLGAQLPLPIRVLCPPEILVLRLRARGQHPA
jgi:predicted MPP superfamily phosphohydrolase